MINIPEELTCLFSAEVEAQDDSYVIEIPKKEIENRYLSLDHDHQVAMVAFSTDSNHRSEQSSDTSQTSEQPPVNEGETRIVEIEDIGNQGDGLTRVDRGYVIIVADTEKGERVRIKIDTVRENVAFANVVERISYYD